MNFEIQAATLRDAKAVAAIHAGTVAPTLESLAFWRDAIEFGEPQVMLAREADKVIGFVGFDRSRDPKTKPTAGEIWALYVLPAYWDQGVGLALWDAAREGLVDEGCTQVTVWLAVANERAMRFVQLAGFKREMSSLKTVPVGNTDTRVEEIRLKRDLA